MIGLRSARQLYVQIPAAMSTPQVLVIVRTVTAVLLCLLVASCASKGPEGRANAANDASAVEAIVQVQEFLPYASFDHYTDGGYQIFHHARVSVQQPATLRGREFTVVFAEEPKPDGPWTVAGLVLCVELPVFLLRHEDIMISHLDLPVRDRCDLRSY